MSNGYIADLSDTTQQMIVTLINEDNYTDLSTNDIEVTNLQPYTGGETSNTEADVIAKPNSQLVGSVVVRYRRMNLDGLSAFEEPLFEVSSTSLDNDDIINLINVKYGTAFTINDFDWSEEIPEPDSEGVAYQLVASENNAAFIGDLEIIIKTPFITGKITQLASGPEIGDTTGVVIGDKLYVPGGVTRGVGPTVGISDLNIYDFTTESWSTANDIEFFTGEEPAVMQANGKMYVLGGAWGVPAPVDLRVYDPDTNSLTTKTSFYTATRVGMSFCSIGNYLYYIGGHEHLSLLTYSDMWRYDVVGETWTQLTSMPVGHTLGMAVTDGQYIYVIAGLFDRFDFENNRSGDLYRYDIANDSWTQLQSMPITLNRHAAVFHENKIYVHSGSKAAGNTFINELYVYDIVSNTWSVLAVVGDTKARSFMFEKDHAVYLYGGDVTTPSLTTTGEFFKIT